MSYKSSYKGSSYRFSSVEGTSSTRLRGTSEDDDSSHSFKYSRRSFNYEDSSRPSASISEDYSSLRASSRPSLRLSSRYSTDSDLDIDTSSTRYSSKYKSILSGDDDVGTTRTLSRYSSRDEGDHYTASSRLTQYSLIESDDDFGHPTSYTSRRQTRYRHDDDDDDDRFTSKSYSRRFVSDSLDDYKVTTPIDDDIKSSYSSEATESTRRYQRSSSTRSLSSKDAGQVYEAILDYKPPRSATDEICLKEGQQVIVLSKDKPHKWKVRTRRTKEFTKVEEGFAPSAYLTAKNETVELETNEPTQEAPKDEQSNLKDLKKKKDMIVRELIETEEDLVRDMQFVQRTYIRQSESSITPKEIKAVKDGIFGNYKDLLEFHKDVMLKNFQTLSKEPSKIGALFIKIDSDFDNHTKYFNNLPKALEILEDNSDVNEFFNNYAVKVRDDKTLADHLKLPKQRINDYQLLLKELSKHLSRMDENVDELEKAIKVIGTISERQEVPRDDNEEEEDVKDSDNKPSDTTKEASDKLSRLLKNVMQAKDYFDVTEHDGKTNERFIFLFKTRMFITEINKNISESQRTYDVKRIIQLPEIEAAIDDDVAKAIIIKSKNISDKTFPILIRANSESQALTWLDLIKSSSKFTDDKSEQGLLDSDMFVHSTKKADGNSIKMKKDRPSLGEPSDVSSDNSATNAATDSSGPSLESPLGTNTKSSACNANVDLLDEANTEATTAATENLRSESSTSVDATEAKNGSKRKSKKDTSSNASSSNVLKIIQPLKSVTKHVGESVTLECQVSKNATSVQWLKDNKPLSGNRHKAHNKDDVHYLDVNNLTFDDAGLYAIVATNSKESVSSSSTLNVINVPGDSRPTSPGGSFLPHAPIFKVKLKDTELLEGTTVRFEVIVRGLPVPTITFFKNGKPLKEDDHLKILFQSKEVFEIMIEHVKMEDAGVYKCVANNSEGQDETSGQITVSSDKNVFWGLDDDEPISFASDISSPRCRSPPFKWFKDGKEFEASERFQVQFDDQEDTIALIFQHVKPEDAGLYTCVASTSSGKISCSAELTVQGYVRELAKPPEVPQVIKELTNIKVAEGESMAALEAQISGYPKPKIEWIKDKKVLESNDHYKMLTEGEENYTLMIKNVKSEDSGQYVLKATNELGSVESAAELTVLKKPKFTKLPDKIEVKSNDKLIIEATYESVPQPDVKWTKDGVELKETNRLKSSVKKDKIQLVIQKATSEDAGKYKCLLSNELGSVSGEVDVIVCAPPKFLKKLEAIQIWEEETATFLVECSGKPQVEFYKNNNLIVKDKRIELKEEENKFFLIINKAQKDDEGSYKCVIKNKYGTEEDSAQLTIKKREVAPGFQEKLKDVEAKVGDENVVLAVKIDGEPKPVCKWFHNGKEITDNYKIVNDEQGSKLIIPKVCNDDHGLFTCKLQNASGQAESSANLIVTGPPYVVKHLENIDTAVDTDVKLTAIIKGNPKPAIKWFVDDKEVKMDKRKKYSYDEASAEHTLIITKIQNEDFGTYKIEASNSFGKCESTSKMQLVSKPSFVNVLKNITVKEMETNVELVVQLDSQTAKPLVKWYKDDKEISDKDKNYKKVESKLDCSYKLVIMKATEEMVGKYKCIASNDFGSAETAAKFNVITKPKFVQGLKDVKVMEGNNVSMTVKIAGFPKPDVAFYKDGQDVSAEATIVVRKELEDIYVLEIENIRIIMSGEYECRIKNEAGEASSKGVVTVQSKPLFVKDLTDQNVNIGGDILLEVVLTGNPSPQIKWFVDGKETKGEERILLDTREEVYKLKIPNAQEQNSGVYHCTASNDLGTASSKQCKVQVVKEEFAPKFVKKLNDVLVVVDDNARFEVVVSAQPEAKVEWSKDGNILKASKAVLIQKNGDSNVLIMKNLQKDDSGVIKCKAENAKGSVSDSAKLTVEEPTLPSISGLSDLSVVDGVPVQIKAQITGFPKPIVCWYKEGECVDSNFIHSEPNIDSYSLNFNPISMGDVGKYTCIATNSAGEATENFSVDITGKKPSFLKELEESIVMSVGKEKNKMKIGQSAIFETIVDGIPMPDVTWLKNETPMSPNNRVTISSVENEHRLEIKEITRDDVAKYTCKAINQFGEALSVCLLKFLNEPHEPIIKKELENVNIEEGETLKLLCKVDGEPMPVVKWFKEDDLLDSDNRVKISSRSDGSTTMLIENVIRTDSGQYEVRAENTKGVASSVASVLVVKPQRPPKFTKCFDSEIKVEFHSPILLDAEVFGLPPPEIEWFKNDKPIDSKDGRIKTSLKDDKECQLVIDRAESGDAGSYSVKAINPNGQATLSTSVKVMPEPFAPLVIKNLPVKVQVEVGESIKLNSSIEAYPLPKITWFKDKVPLEESDRLKMTASPSGALNLVIEDATPSDQGVYSVTAENSVGETTTSTQVDIVSPSLGEITKTLQDNMQVNTKEPLVLTASVENVNPSDVVWLKDGKVVEANAGVQFSHDNNDYSMIVSKPQLEDSGIYSLVVNTPTEKLQTQSSVKVILPPKDTDAHEALDSHKKLLENEDQSRNDDVDQLNRSNDAMLGPNQNDSESVRDLPIKDTLEKAQTISQDTEMQRVGEGKRGSDFDATKFDENVGGNDSGKKPKFKTGLSQVEVVSGNPCRLECVVDGNPNDFTASWYKDGEEILPNEHYGFVKEPNGTLALLVDSFSFKDMGEYTIKVSQNDGAEATSTCKALLKEDIKSKPIFVDQIAPVSAEEKSPFSVKAKITPASVPFESKWFHNNKELKQSDTVKFLNFPDGTVMLQIDEAKMSDAGTYKVEVSNTFGKSSGETNVTVRPKGSKLSTVVKELVPTTLVAGQSGVLELKMDTCEGDIKFLHDGKQVLPTDRVHIQQLPDGVVRLIFDSVNLDDQGDYTFVFHNENGQVKTSAPVTVKSKPIITRKLSDKSVKDGCSIKFETEIKGNPKPKITWFKNGLDLEVDSRHVTTFEGKDGLYYLVLENCNFKDEAEYSVSAVNDLGEATSEALLSVIGGDKFEECAPQFMQSLQEIKAKPGDTITLRAKVKSHPVPTITWKKNGKEISLSDRVLSNFDGANVELIISNADSGDFALYELTVKNNLGEASTSAQVKAFENQAPKFVKKLSDAEKDVKVQSKLACRVEAFPEPKIVWTVNGKVIEPGFKYSTFQELDEQILLVANPSESDSGVYECVATNDLGSDSTSANIHFMEKDKAGEAAQFLTKLHDFDALPGGVARFIACVIGSPKPDLKWFKNGDEISIDNRKYFVEYQDNGMIKFEVRDVCDGDLGKYRCHASNIYGYDNSIAQLNFETIDGLDRSKQSHKSQKSQRRALDADDIDYKTSGLPIPLPDVPKITKMTDSSLTLLWLPSIPEQPRFPVSYVVEFAKVPDGNWVLYQSDVKDTKCDVTDLEKFQDYSFRIRVENKFGVSDPSPSVTAFRSKLREERQPKDAKPEDFDIKHLPKEKIAAAPKFLREEDSFKYGMCGQPITLEFWVYGFPEPNITWYFGDQKIEHNDKFSFLQDRGGKICLFINKMNLTDVGIYTCVAKNEHGEEKRTIKLLNAEPPVFTKRLEETTVCARNHVRLECNVKGTPEPTIKWFKDFQPMHDTSRVNVMWQSPDTATLTISDLITRDVGLYSCTATNVAGSTTSAAFLHVKEADISYEKYPFSYNKAIKPKNKTIEQFYDIGDELGRGTQGITYHSVERSSGSSFAAKMMHGMGEMKSHMMSELDIMNQLGGHERLVQLKDAFAATPHSLSLVMDLCGGGPLLESILKKGFLTENEVAYYIKQILEGLHYMNFKNLGHFGLTIGDILMERINGLEIRICDFGLAQRVIPGTTHFVEFGHPEFVSPEIVSKNSVTFSSDVWSVGIITYILLTGISPFLAENDRATLQNISNKKIDLTQNLDHISENGRDFLRKVLDYDSKARLDVKSALNHPWLKLANHPESGNRLDILDKLRHYQSRYKSWYDNASCRRYYRRRALHSCYTHPSRMIYPPDESYSPLISPEREIKKYAKTVSPFENIYAPSQFEGENFQSESHYQSGPDTYLLQLRDTDFPARIRKYLRIAATSSPSIASNLKQSHWGSNPMASMKGHVPQVSIKERRKFTDVMDEEIGDEIKGLTNRNKPSRLLREVGTSSYAVGQINALRKEARIRAEPDEEINYVTPYFREKLKDESFKSGENVVFTCYAVGNPCPTYTWFRNDTILIENSRVEVKRCSDGRCQLKIKPGREYDVGVYKCVARNSQGSVVCRARLNLGDVPGVMTPPIVKDGSAHDILLAWTSPKLVGNANVQFFKLEYKKIDSDQWVVANEAIKEEFYLLTGLEPNSSYHFRLSACNKFGWGDPSPPCEVANTLTLEENRTVNLPSTMRFVCNKISPTADNEEQYIDYSREVNPVPLIKSEFKDLYDFKSLIANGTFSVITQAYIKDGSRLTLATKCVLTQSEKESSMSHEYETMKSLAHEKIAKLCYANRDSNLFTLAMEMLSGLNVLTYLSRKQFYTENCVSKIICQVLDAIEYLHFRGLGLLELQPDNLLVVDDRNLQIKLTDFANARQISSKGGKVSIAANVEYIAPELIRNDDVLLPYTDIWCVGVLTYILLSGHSPFVGEDAKETAQNVVFVRYLFDRLYPQVTQEAIRFLLTIFKLTPHKRPTIEECFDNKWLIPNDFMVKKRDLAIFNTTKLCAFSDDFFAKKSRSQSRLMDLIGLKE